MGTMPIFPIPRYLEMPAVGIDISDDAVRFMELVPYHDHLRVSRYATRNFPLGLIQEGRIKDVHKLQETIAELAEEYKLLFANISLPEEQAYIVNMRIPKASEHDIRTAIEIHLEEYAPVSGTDAIFDYMTVEDPKHQRDSIDAVVSVLPRSTVDEYLAIFHNTGIIPKAFEFESQAMARAIIPRGDLGTYMIVDLGKVVTEIIVKAQGVVQFSASLDMGGRMLTQAIERNMKITYDEAEALKLEHGIVNSAKSKNVYEAILPAIADLRGRFMRHYTYWQTHHAEKFGGSVEHVFLTGGGANLKGLPEYLSSQLDVGVSTANPWVNVASSDQYIPPITAQESLGFSAAIGLSLRHQHLI